MQSPVILVTVYVIRLVIFHQIQVKNKTLVEVIVVMISKYSNIHQNNPARPRSTTRIEAHLKTKF